MIYMKKVLPYQNVAKDSLCSTMEMAKLISPPSIIKKSSLIKFKDTIIMYVAILSF